MQQITNNSIKSIIETLFEKKQASHVINFTHHSAIWWVELVSNLQLLSHASHVTFHAVFLQGNVLDTLFSLFLLLIS